MSKLRTVLKCTGFLAGLIIIIGLCDYFFAQAGYINFILRQVTDQKQNYDTIVLGASHTRAAIDPQFIDEALGTNTLNLGIPGETIKDSYYILRHAAKKNKIKRVILDVDYQYWVNPQGEGYFNESFIYAQMSWTSPAKWKYLIENMDCVDIRTAFTKRNVYKCSLKSALKNIKFKNSETYRNKDLYNIDIPDANGYYVGKGFCYREVSGNQPGGQAYIDTWTERSQMGVSKLIEEQFVKINNYCKKNGIELIAVTSPITPSAMKQLKMEYAAQSLRQDIFDKYEVPYYDFNVSRFDVVPREDADYGDMEGHMGGKIGQEYSKVLAQLLKDHVNGNVDNNKYFYASYDEMYKNMAKDFAKAENTSEGKDK